MALAVPVIRTDADTVVRSALTLMSVSGPRASWPSSRRALVGVPLCCQSLPHRASFSTAPGAPPSSMPKRTEPPAKQE